MSNKVVILPGQKMLPSLGFATEVPQIRWFFCDSQQIIFIKQAPYIKM